MSDATLANTFEVSDALWEKAKVLIPQHANTHRFGGGRPRKDDRTCFNAIFFVLRTGCQWNALDATGLCPSSTAHDRFQEWTEAGVFTKLWQAGLEEYDDLKGLDGSFLSMDGAMTKAPLGGEKNRAESHGSRQGRRQAVAPDRGRGRAGGRRRRGREPARHEAGA